MSPVPCPTMPFLGTEKQVWQAKYFNQGHHTLNSRRKETELASDCPISVLHKLGDLCSGNTTKNRHDKNH